MKYLNLAKSSKNYSDLLYTLWYTLLLKGERPKLPHENRKKAKKFDLTILIQQSIIIIAQCTLFSKAKRGKRYIDDVGTIRQSLFADGIIIYEDNPM